MAQHAKIGLGQLAGRRIGDPHGDHRRAEVARGSRELTLCCSRYAFLAITLRQDLVAVLDYPAALTPYALRDPGACTRQAAQVGLGVEQFVRVLLSGVFPWARLRQAQKL